MIKKILFISSSLLLLMTAGRASAQEVPADTAVVIPQVTAQQKEKEEEVHSPRKAALYSAMLPGLGQAYNRKYWKIPLVYGGFAAFGYSIGWNNNLYQTSRRAYVDLTDGDESTTSYMNLKQIIYYNLDNPSDVENLKRGLLRSQDYYRRNRDLLVILTIAFYGLNIIDASVDAHFFNFDISDDLTFNWQPTIDQLNNKNFLSLNCTIRF